MTIDRIAIPSVFQSTSYLNEESHAELLTILVANTLRNYSMSANSSSSGFFSPKEIEFLAKHIQSKGPDFTGGFLSICTNSLKAVYDVAKKWLWECYVVGYLAQNNNDSQQAKTLLKSDSKSLVKAIEDWKLGFSNNSHYVALKCFLKNVDALKEIPIVSYKNLLTQFAIDKLLKKSALMPDFIEEEVIEEVIDELRKLPFINRMIALILSNAKVKSKFSEWLMKCYVSCYMNQMPGDESLFLCKKWSNYPNNLINACAEKWKAQKCLEFIPLKFFELSATSSTDNKVSCVQEKKILKQSLAFYLIAKLSDKVIPSPQELLLNLISAVSTKKTKKLSTLEIEAKNDKAIDDVFESFSTLIELSQLVNFWNANTHPEVNKSTITAWLWECYAFALLDSECIPNRNLPLKFGVYVDNPSRKERLQTWIEKRCGGLMPASFRKAFSTMPSSQPLLFPIAQVAQADLPFYPFLQPLILAEASYGWSNSDQESFDEGDESDPKKQKILF